jgi:hypothetical protein
MNYERAVRAAKSTGYRRLAVVASMLAAATILAAPHLSAAASREVIATMHAAWLRITAPGMQFPAGQLTPRPLKIWLGVLSAACLVRLNSRFSQISIA